MLLIFLVVAINFGLIIADEKDESKKFIELLSQNDKEIFLENMARRIMGNVASEPTNGTDEGKKAEVEISDDQLNKQSEYVNKVVKEEIGKMKKTLKTRQEEEVDGKKANATEKNLKTQNGSVIGARRKRATKEEKITLPKEDLNSSVSIEVVVKDPPTKVEVKSKKDEIPVAVVYDTPIIKKNNKSKTVKEASIPIKGENIPVADVQNISLSTRRALNGDENVSSVPVEATSEVTNDVLENITSSSIQKEASVSVVGNGNSDQSTVINNVSHTINVIPLVVSESSNAIQNTSVSALDLDNKTEGSSIMSSATEVTSTTVPPVKNEEVNITGNSNNNNTQKDINQIKPDLYLPVASVKSALYLPVASVPNKNESNTVLPVKNEEVNNTTVNSNKTQKDINQIKPDLYLPVASVKSALYLPVASVPNENASNTVLPVKNEEVNNTNVNSNKTLKDINQVKSDLYLPVASVKSALYLPVASVPNENESNTVLPVKNEEVNNITVNSNKTLKDINQVKSDLYLPVASPPTVNLLESSTVLVPSIENRQVKIDFKDVSKPEGPNQEILAGSFTSPKPTEATSIENVSNWSSDVTETNERKNLTEPLPDFRTEHMIWNETDLQSERIITTTEEIIRGRTAFVGGYPDESIEDATVPYKSNYAALVSANLSVTKAPEFYHHEYETSNEANESESTTPSHMKLDGNNASKVLQFRVKETTKAPRKKFQKTPKRNKPKNLKKPMIKHKIKPLSGRKVTYKTKTSTTVLVVTSPKTTSFTSGLRVTSKSVKNNKKRTKFITRSANVKTTKPRAANVKTINPKAPNKPGIKHKIKPLSGRKFTHKTKTSTTVLVVTSPKTTSFTSGLRATSKSVKNNKKRTKVVTRSANGKTTKPRAAKFSKTIKVVPSTTTILPTTSKPVKLTHKYKVVSSPTTIVTTTSKAVRLTSKDTKVVFSSTTTEKTMPTIINHTHKVIEVVSTPATAITTTAKADKLTPKDTQVVSSSTTNNKTMPSNLNHTHKVINVVSSPATVVTTTYQDVVLSPNDIQGASSPNTILNTLPITDKVTQKAFTVGLVTTETTEPTDIKLIPTNINVVSSSASIEKHMFTVVNVPRINLEDVSSTVILMPSTDNLNMNDIKDVSTPATILPIPLLHKYFETESTSTNHEPTKPKALELTANNTKIVPSAATIIPITPIALNLLYNLIENVSSPTLETTMPKAVGLSPKDIIVEPSAATIVPITSSAKKFSPKDIEVLPSAATSVPNKPTADKLTAKNIEFVSSTTSTDANFTHKVVSSSATFKTTIHTPNKHTNKVFQVVPSNATLVPNTSKDVFSTDKDTEVVSSSATLETTLSTADNHTHKDFQVVPSNATLVPNTFKDVSLTSKDIEVASLFATIETTLPTTNNDTHKDFQIVPSNAALVPKDINLISKDNKVVSSSATFETTLPTTDNHTYKDFQVVPSNGTLVPNTFKDVSFTSKDIEVASAFATLETTLPTTNNHTNKDFQVVPSNATLVPTSKDINLISKDNEVVSSSATFETTLPTTDNHTYEDFQVVPSNATLVPNTLKDVTSTHKNIEVVSSSATLGTTLPTSYKHNHKGFQVVHSKVTIVLTTSKDVNLTQIDTDVVPSSITTLTNSKSITLNDEVIKAVDIKMLIHDGTILDILQNTQGTIEEILNVSMKHGHKLGEKNIKKLADALGYTFEPEKEKHIVKEKRTKKKEYIVYEIPEGEDPFKKTKILHIKGKQGVNKKIGIFEASKHSSKSVVQPPALDNIPEETLPNEGSDKIIQDNKPIYYAPVHDYDPKYAYYNPANIYHPNGEEKIQTEDVIESGENKAPSQKGVKVDVQKIKTIKLPTDTEQIYYAPVHNYDPKYAYFNPANLYGPNPDEIFKEVPVNSAENGPGTVVGKLIDHFDFAIQKPVQRAEKEKDVKENDSKRQDVNKFLNLLFSGNNKDLLRYPSKGKWPDSQEIDHPYPGMLNNQPPIDSIVKSASEILHKLNYFGYQTQVKMSTTTTTEDPFYERERKAKRLENARIEKEKKKNQTITIVEEVIVNGTKKNVTRKVTSSKRPNWAFSRIVFRSLNNDEDEEKSMKEFVQAQRLHQRRSNQLKIIPLAVPTATNTDPGKKQITDLINLLQLIKQKQNVKKSSFRNKKDNESEPSFKNYYRLDEDPSNAEQNGKSNVAMDYYFGFRTKKHVKEFNDFDDFISETRSGARRDHLDDDSSASVEPNIDNANKQALMLLLGVKTPEELFAAMKEMNTLYQKLPNIKEQAQKYLNDMDKFEALLEKMKPHFLNPSNKHSKIPITLSPLDMPYTSTKRPKHKKPPKIVIVPERSRSVTPELDYFLKNAGPKSKVLPSEVETPLRPAYFKNIKRFGYELSEEQPKNKLNQKPIRGSALPKLSGSTDVTLDIYVNVMLDMLKMDSRALEKYDWLGSTVDIRSSLKKLINLCENLRENSAIHPKDFQLLKYIQYLYDSTKEHLALHSEVSTKNDPLDKRNDMYYQSLDSVARTNNTNKINKNKKTELMSVIKRLSRPWVRKDSLLAELDEFEEFWIGLDNALSDLHNAIKHIALITPFKSQRWYRNLKELYLSDASRKQILELLLHVVFTKVIEMVEASSSKIDTNYVRYALASKEDVERTKEEFVFLMQLYKQLKKFNH